MNEFKRKIAYNDKIILNVIHSAIRLSRVVTLASLTHFIFISLWYSTAAHSKSPQVYINNFDAYWQTATGFWILLVCATMVFAILQSYRLGKFLRRFWSAIIYLGFTGLFLYAYDNFNYMIFVVLVALFSTSMLMLLKTILQIFGKSYTMNQTIRQCTALSKLRLDKRMCCLNCSMTDVMGQLLV